MVGVVGSSPIAPTKIGREIKHLAETLGAFFLVVRKKYGKPELGVTTRPCRNCATSAEMHGVIGATWGQTQFSEVAILLEPEGD